MSYRSSSYRRGGSSGFAHELAYGLGWFSIGLGAVEVLAPGALARTLGMPGSEPILRAFGLREIASGVAILSSDNPAPWVWARVGGDALDIGTLANACHEDNPRRGNVGLALAAVAGVTALDVFCAAALSSGGGEEEPWRTYDYSDRSGLPMPADAMRGAARDFEVPRDYRTPEALRPYTTA
jgi:hypothetical protein